MTSSSDPQTRRLAGRILLWQAVVVLALAGLLAVVAGLPAGGDALIGGAIGWVANLYMTIAALRPARTAGVALNRLLVGQFDVGRQNRANVGRVGQVLDGQQCSRVVPGHVWHQVALAGRGQRGNKSVQFTHG